MLANTLNRWLVGRFGCDRVLLMGAFAALGASIWAGFAAHTGIGGLWGLVAPLFLFASTTGFIVANSITGALADFPQSAGAVSALTGAVQYGSGILGSGLVGLWSDGTPRPLGLVVALSGIGCLLSMLLLVPATSGERSVTN